MIITKETLFLLGGILGGWFLQRLTQINSGPNFGIKLGTTPIFLPNTSSQVKFINIEATNLKRNFLLRLLVDNNISNNTRCWVRFLDPETRAELLKINGRWTSTKEPIDYKGQINIGDALITSRETIPPGESSEISIAVKLDGEIGCYAFNNESYLYGWKKPDFELKEKRYIVNIKIASNDKEWEEDFVLLNPSESIKNFRLISI